MCCISGVHLVCLFSRVLALQVHDPQVQGSVRTLQEVCLLPQPHSLLEVLFKLLVVPAQSIHGWHRPLQRGGGQQLIFICVEETYHTHTTLSIAFLRKVTAFGMSCLTPCPCVEKVIILVTKI